jgi:hypothetical protein
MTRLLLVLAVIVVPVFAQERSRDTGQVRAKEPTVVTVRGTADAVETNRAEQKKGFGTRVGRGARNVATKTWNGIVDFGGWLLNGGDDVPSERERKADNAQRR